MKRWVSGGVTFILICVITIITEWYDSNKKEEIYETYRSGYYDTIEQKGSRVEIERMDMFLLLITGINILLQNHV